MAAKYSLQNIHQLENRKIFFDANVLIYIFWPSGAYKWESYYSSAFGKLLRQKNELLVDFIVISEIVNRSHRLEYEKHLNHLTKNNIQKNKLSYKNYRDSIEGCEALSDIYLMIETNILNCFTIVGKAFNKSEILSFLTLDKLDFSDKGILSICKENSCVLLTNDRDYINADIDILSSNPKLLNNL